MWMLAPPSPSPSPIHKYGGGGGGGGGGAGLDRQYYLLIFIYGFILGNNETHRKDNKQASYI